MGRRSFVDDAMEDAAMLLRAAIEANRSLMRLEAWVWREALRLCGRLSLRRELVGDVVRDVGALRASDAGSCHGIPASAEEIVAAWGAMFCVSGMCDRVGAAVRVLRGEGGQHGARAWLLLGGGACAHAASDVASGGQPYIVGLHGRRVPPAWSGTSVAVDPCAAAGAGEPELALYEDVGVRVEWVAP